jgi:hypothetical protein
VSPLSFPLSFPLSLSDFFPDFFFKHKTARSKKTELMHKPIITATTIPSCSLIKILTPNTGSKKPPSSLDGNSLALLRHVLLKNNPRNIYTQRGTPQNTTNTNG